MDKTDNKVVKGSLILFLGNFFFRIGGYINRVLMSRMLGPEGYGLYCLTLPFQGIFQILSAGGLPPAISKYVAEYHAKDENQMARQVIITSTKFMILMGILLSLVILFSSDFIANSIFHKPLVVWPLRAVALITPFSVVVGAMRGAYLGVYESKYTVYNRLTEQVGTIIFAVIFVYVGMYAMGAVLGTAFGFIISATTGVYLYKKHILPMFNADPDNFLTFNEELSLIKKLIKFTIPVVITALSEMAIYDVDTLVIGIFLLSSDIGYYSAADPIARIPLMISLSVSTILLPATAEAYTLKNMKLLHTYIIECIRYSILIVTPLCIGISIFSKPVITLFFGNSYAPGSLALSILVIGMTFYTIYMICSSILQGIGHPHLPMYILLGGTILNIILNVNLVPKLGIIGAATSTTTTTFILMIIILYVVLHSTKIKMPWHNLFSILISNIFVAITCYLLPNTYIGLFIGIILGAIVYIMSIIHLKILTERDLKFLTKYTYKINRIKPIVTKIVDYINKHDLLYKTE